VIGFRLDGELPEGATATDLVLTVTQMLRERGVVGKFVEFFGDGLARLPLADRATISNMAPEQGATCVMFPIDAETLHYLRFTGRSEEQVVLVEAYAREQGMFHEPGAEEATYTDTLVLDLADVEPSLAGPRRPQDRVALKEAKESFVRELHALVEAGAAAAGNGDLERFAGEGGHTAVGVEQQSKTAVEVTTNGEQCTLDHGSIVIAAITSCTNTSNPAVMVCAGLLAKRARERGLESKPWVKTSLAPGSKVVTDYYERAGLTKPLDELGFNLVGYGCTTCIGNSGPLPDEISAAIEQGDLAVASVLSGNRNFEGRIHSEVKMNYLASPPLVVAYALAGRMDVDLVNDPLGTGSDGEPVYLRDIWPTEREIHDTIEQAVQSDMFTRSYADVYAGDERWNSLDVPEGDLYDWRESTYVKRPPYFDGMPAEPAAIEPVTGARVLALLGDSVTTDHISPAGAIRKDSPAGRYLIDKGVEPRDFNSYGSRRGNHEVMMRGTFANVRLRNQLAPGTEGPWTVHLPDGEEMTIFDASMRYQEEGTPLVVIAGKEYGSGSSRDWAAKGPRLLGVRAVIAQSYERIHRSNLVGMGIVPLQFADGESAESLGLTGRETFDVGEVAEGSRTTTVTARPDDGEPHEFEVTVRIDTPQEWQYYRHGGILHFVLRELAQRNGSA
jgi:aconitate hydratase